MKAILLAAGVGSRISDDINHKPKSLLEVNGKPIIVHTVELLQKNHIEVSIITGFKHNLVEEALKGYGVKFYYNPFYRVTNSMGSLWYAREEMNTNEVIIGNGDVYYEQNLLDLIFAADKDNFLLEDKSRILVGDYFFNSSNGILNKYGKELKEEERTGEYVGLCCLRNQWVEIFKERLCQMIENGEYGLWWENVLYSFVGEKEIYTLDVGDAFWGEVDTIEDYQRVLAHCEGQ